MASFTPAIEKLQKKLEKEPNSLIFLQLAEEFRKENEYQAALSVCQDGLRRHPNYWSARVALGRIYHEMGESEQAREELEKVIKAVPDNLLANRLLGDIYMSSHRYEDALKRYQLVQMLTPADQEVITNIQKLEAKLSGAVQQDTEQVGKLKPGVIIPTDVPAATVEMQAPKLESFEPQDNEADFPRLQPSSADLPPFSDDLPSFLEKTEPGTTSSRKLSSLDSTMPGSFKPAKWEDEEPATVLEGEDVDEQDSVSVNVAQRVDVTQPMEELEADELTTQTLAELYVQQGLIDKATKVYQKLLLNDPENQEIVQRLKELNPADALLAAAAAQEQKMKAASKLKTIDFSAGSGISSRNMDHLSEERRRKISTLENWLAAIRRERS